MVGRWFGKMVVKELVYLYKKQENLPKETRRLQGDQVNPLLQELRFIFQVLENNVKELQGQEKPPRGLMFIPTSHVEYVLFSSEPSLSLEQRSLDAMEKYLQLANHHNVLIQNGFLQMGASQTGGATRIFADWSPDGTGSDPIPMTMNELGPSLVHFARLIIKDLQMMDL